VSASGVHDLLNIVSLIHPLHAAFHHLKLALEPTADTEVRYFFISRLGYDVGSMLPQPNTYDVVFAHPGRALGFEGLKNCITAIDHTQEQAQKGRLKHAGTLSLPLPDPRLLALHAVCVRVSHMSGAVDFLNGIDCSWRMEWTVVLAQVGIALCV
jgi:hypothetical protein